MGCGQCIQADPFRGTDGTLSYNKWHIDQHSQDLRRLEFESDNNHVKPRSDAGGARILKLTCELWVTKYPDWPAKPCWSLEDSCLGLKSWRHSELSVKGQRRKLQCLRLFLSHLLICDHGTPNFLDNILTSTWRSGCNSVSVPSSFISHYFRDMRRMDKNPSMWHLRICKSQAVLLISLSPEALSPSLNFQNIHYLGMTGSLVLVWFHTKQEVCLWGLLWSLYSHCPYNSLKTPLQSHHSEG